MTYAKRRRICNSFVFTVSLIGYLVLASAGFADALLPTGSMSIARYGHTATLLQDGRVLIAGGATTDTPQQVTTASETYDPATGAFSPTDALDVPRWNHSAIRLDDGRVLIVGGWRQSFNVPTETAEIFDPASDTFSPVGNMTIARSDRPPLHKLPDGRVLVIGGAFEGNSATGTDRIDVFDPTTNSFSLFGMLDTARKGHGVCSIPDGKLLVQGGRLDCAACSPAENAIRQRSAEILDTASGLSTALVEVTTYDHLSISFNHAVTLSDGRCLLSGPQAGNFGFETFDPVAGTFTPHGVVSNNFDDLTTMPSGQVLFSSTFLGLFEPSQDAITDTGLSSDRSDHSATVLSDGRVLLAGGRTGDSFLSDADLYVPSPANAGPSFMGVGDLPGGDFESFAADVSADGSVVVGTSHATPLSGDSISGSRAFRWTEAGGMVSLGDLPGGVDFSEAIGVSADGFTVFGNSFSSGGGRGTREVFRYTDPPMQAIGIAGEIFGVSADSNAITGRTAGEPGLGIPPAPFWWTEASGITELVGADEILPRGISGDGNVVVGEFPLAGGELEAFRWTETEGLDPLGDLPGASSGIDVFSRAFAASNDGSVIVGLGTSSSGTEPFRLTAAGEIGEMMVALDLPLDSVGAGWARDVSADGAVVVGRYTTSTSPLIQEAFLWTAEAGARNLKDLLETDHGLDLTGWDLLGAVAVSADGSTVVGDGMNPDGNREGWVARLGDASQSLLLVSPLNLPFGPVDVGSVKNLEFTLTNDGDVELAGVISTDAPFFLQSPDMFALVPGEAQTVTVRFAPSAEGAAVGAATVTADTPESPYTVVLSGEGVLASPVLTANVSVLEFGPIVVGNSKDLQFTLFNDSALTVDVSLVTAVPFSVMNDHTFDLPPGSSTVVSVEFTPTVPGDIEGTLTIVSDVASVPEPIVLVGEALPEPERPVLSLSQAQIDFGGQTVDTISTAEFVTIRNIGDEDLVIGTLLLSGSDTGDFVLLNDSCTGVALISDANCSLSVEFHPTSVGARGAQIIIPNNADGNPHEVSLIGEGIELPKKNKLPVVNNITPNSGVLDTEVVLKGRNFGQLGGSSRVFFGSKSAGITSWADTEIKVSAPMHPEGDVEVVVQTELVIRSSPKIFNYFPAVSISPAEIRQVELREPQRFDAVLFDATAQLELLFLKIADAEKDGTGFFPGDECYAGAMDAAATQQKKSLVQFGLKRLASGIFKAGLSSIPVGSELGKFLLRLGGEAGEFVIEGKTIEQLPGELLVFITKEIAGFAVGLAVDDFSDGRTIASLSTSVILDVLELDEVTAWNLDGDKKSGLTVPTTIKARIFYNPFTHYTSGIIGAECQFGSSVSNNLYIFRYRVSKGFLNVATMVERTFAAKRVNLD